MTEKKRKQGSIAEKNFEPSNYKSVNDLEQGLAITHEQVNDTLTEGTIDDKPVR